MNTNAPKSPKHQGFTLIELLVVIAIIAILAGLSLSAYRTTVERANQVSAQAAMGNLVQACDNYYEDYGQLPLSEGVLSDEVRLSDNELMSVLVGLESAINGNPKKESYFTFTRAKGRGDHKYAGLDRSDTHAKLYGPWKNKNESDRFFRLKFDYDFNQEISEPSDIGGESIYDRRVLIFHLGKDGKAGHGHNSDNVYNYK